MAYPVNRKDGSILVSVNDGVKDNSATTINLLGRGYKEYGEVMAENLVWMAENYADTTPPENPLNGQLWFDKGTNKMRYLKNDNTTWEGLATDTEVSILQADVDTLTARSIHVGNSAPAGPSQEGDLWWKSFVNELWGYDADNTIWVKISA